MAFALAARMSLRLMKALFLTRKTLTSGESSRKVTHPVRSASVKILLVSAFEAQVQNKRSKRMLDPER